MPRGRGSDLNPPNRFLTTRQELDPEHLEFDDDFWAEQSNLKTRFLPDASQSIISENDSPDIPFRYSLNAYRGCEHGCAYCYPPTKTCHLSASP